MTAAFFPEASGRAEELGSATAPEGPTPPLKPYRYSIDWCSAETDLDEAQVLYDSIVDWIERGGGFPQGGIVQLMPADDVVPRSPLSVALDSGAEPDRAERTE